MPLHEFIQHSNDVLQTLVLWMFQDHLVHHQNRSDMLQRIAILIERHCCSILQLIEGLKRLDKDWIIMLVFTNFLANYLDLFCAQELGSCVA